MRSESSSSTCESSSSILAPVGFNIDRVRKLHQTSSSHSSVMSKLEDLKISDEKVIKELEYEYLLENAMSLLHKSTIELNMKKKVPLDIKREAGQKTSINLEVVSKSLNRNSDHLKTFILKELHTTGSVNIEGRLILRGVFIKSKVQSVVKRFIEMFVKCLVCNKFDTEILREKRMWFLSCKRCQSKRSVEIDGGFYNKNN